ncbi:MAG: hypothetical protein IPI79_10520 [Moraxellaceae bacterium]|nr:hypothetical protein [Moraxellaceae bacterium]
MSTHSARYLFCTANHPFWCAERQQWLPVIDFKSCQQLIDLQGETLEIQDDVGYVMATGKAKIGICHALYSDYRRNQGYSMMVDFAGSKIRFVGGDEPLWTGVSHRHWWHPDEETILLPHYDNEKDFPQYSLSRFYKQAFNERPTIDFIHPDNPNPDLEAVFKDYVYNIEIEDFHTYFIGKAGILTHTSANITP